MGETSTATWHTKNEITEAREGGERTFTFKVRRDSGENVIGWRIGFGGGDVLVAEGSGYGLQYGRRLFEDLVEGRSEFPGKGDYTGVKEVLVR